MSRPDRRASGHSGRDSGTRQLEPDLRLVRGRSPVLGVCASFTGALLAGALLLGGVTTVSGVAGAALASCDVRASEARLSGARHLVTTLRLSHNSDARRSALAGDLQSMGLTPAISTGWRQQAVDVSDRLIGTTDPALNRVAITLARSGVGPTPADLHPPGSVQELLNTSDQPLDGLSDAVTAAGVAAGALSATPPANVPRTTSGTPPAGGGRAPRLRIEPPRACSDPGDETGPAAPGTATGTTTATAGPDSSATDPTSTSSVPDGSPPATATGDSDAFGTAPTMTSESDAADPTNLVPDSTDPRTSAPDMSTDGPAAPDTSDDLRDAAAAVQAVADLLRSLSDESTSDAQRLADQIRDVLPQLRVPDPADSRNPDPAAPQRSDTPEPPTTMRPSTVRTTVPTAPATGDETADPSPSDPTSVTGNEPGGDWESQARQLADQAQQAAGTDPLARELATKLDAAGFGDGADPGTDEPETGTPPSDPTAPPSADPSGPSSPTTTTDRSSAAPPSSSATSDVDSEPGTPTDRDVSPATWDRLAQCESSGDWAADTGNGYAGGLQLAPATWQAFGGQDSPSDASRSEQIAVAQKVKDAQGWSAWPACSTKLGLR